MCVCVCVCVCVAGTWTFFVYRKWIPAVEYVSLRCQVSSGGSGARLLLTADLCQAYPPVTCCLPLVAGDGAVMNARKRNKGQAKGGCCRHRRGVTVEGLEAFKGLSGQYAVDVLRLVGLTNVYGCSCANVRVHM